VPDGARSRPMNSRADELSAYYLSRDVFFCRADRSWIFLDVRNDKYFAIPTSEAECLARAIERTQQPHLSQSADLPAQTIELAKDLTHRGVLCTDPRQARTLEATEFTRPTSTVQGDERSASSVPASDLVHVLAHTMLAHLQLRLLPFRSIVRSVARNATPKSTSAHGFDTVAAARLIQIYNAARPMFPRKYLCLFDCLALLRWFHAHRLYPAWVFGVTEDPFSAHCWLQSDSIVLNDNLDRVNAYTPIMAL
jgi:hypothetical protein